MPERSFPLWFPETETTSLIAMIVGSILLVVGGVFFEYFRRRMMRVAQARAEWRSVEHTVHEKALTDDQRALLYSMIERFSPMEPLRALTQHHVFDRCVDSMMDEIQNDEARYRERGLLLRELRAMLGLDFIPFGQPIGSTRDLSIGQPIWLAPGDSSGLTWTKASIYGIDDAYFRVSLRLTEIRSRGGLTLASGDLARCYLWREDDARYEFKTFVAGSETDPPVWIFRHTSKLNRIQVRNYYRVRFDQQTTVRIMRAPEDDEKSPGFTTKRTLTYLSGRISSLSAGGLALVASQPAPLQAYMRLRLHLPEEGSFDVESRIVSVEPLNGGRHLVRARFVDIPEATRDAIAQYVWKRQQPKLGNGGNPEQMAKRPPSEI